MSRRRPRAGAVPGVVLTAMIGAVFLGCGDRSPGTDGIDQAFVAVEVEGCDGLAPRIASGFVIRPGVIATVAHIFFDDGELDVEEITVVPADGISTTADVVALDPDRDLALLRIAGSDGADEPNGTGADTALEPADDVPDGPVLVITRAGIIEAEIEERRIVTLDGVGAREAMRLDVSVDRGDSGAPVVAEGRLVGMVFAVIRPTPGEDASGSWAIAASEIQRFAEAELSADAAPLTPACPS